MNSRSINVDTMHGRAEIKDGHFGSLRARGLNPILITFTLAGLFLSLGVWQARAEQEANRPSLVEAERQMKAPERVFISGHSLLSDQISADLAAIASSLGHPFVWKGQYLDGSSIKRRSFGDGTEGQQWSGYANGLAPVGRENGSVLDELRRPENHPKEPYDALLITEQHSVLISLVWNETPRYLRDFHDRFSAHNANGITFFYEPWLSIDNKSDPRGWIAYERSADPVWRCVVEQTNAAIAAGGGRDRIRFVPVSLALADLIERATQKEGLPGITRDSVRATVDSLVADDVHLTRLGKYYVALVTFAFMSGISLQGAWHPSDVTREQAVSLQKMASASAAQEQPAVMSLQGCRNYVRKTFLWKYLRYEVATGWRGERGIFASLYLGARLAFQWYRLFSADGPENPFSAAAYRIR
jgi:hypothetical protein